MKKNTLIIVIILAITNVRAQVFYGLKAGGNYSLPTMHDYYSKPRLGANIGAFAQIKLSNDFEGYFRPEIMYSQQGESNKLNSNNKLIKIDEQHYLDYLCAPLLFKIYFSNYPREYYTEFGPQIGFLLNSSSTNNLGGNPKYNDVYNKLDFGILLGFGYSLNKKTEFGTRIAYGLSDAVQNQTQDFVTNRQLVISANISYTLFGENQAE